ncbi:MAG: nuclear transport factor 2 family protein [Thermodesulfobacteriota bacterium]
MDAKTVEKEVRASFDGLMAAINAKDAAAWADFYSKGGFVSAAAGTDRFSARKAWVEAVQGFFASRKRQLVTPGEVRITELSPGVALLTSEEKTEFTLMDGGAFKGTHLFTMIWKREAGGWKIVHSHESWADA